jgi:hypothetical protein
MLECRALFHPEADYCRAVSPWTEEVKEQAWTRES